MNVSFRVLVTGIVIGLCPAAWGQYPVEYPGEYVVSGPVVNGTVVNQPVSQPFVSGPIYSAPIYDGTTSASVVGDGVYYAESTPVQAASNASTVSYNSTFGSGAVNQASSGILDVVNSKRQRSGLPALMLDVQLEQVAQNKSNIRANRRITGHDNSHRGGARVEGVGHAYGGNLLQRFNTCYLYSNGYTHAGAAIAYDNSGQAYYTLLLR